MCQCIYIYIYTYIYTDIGIHVHINPTQGDLHPKHTKDYMVLVTIRITREPAKKKNPGKKCYNSGMAGREKATTI